MPYLERLKELKKERGFTNAEIAKLSNIPLATITRVFNGSTPNPTFETFAQIAISMGASLDEIAGLRPIESPPPVDAHIENTLNSYVELLKEKDIRLKEKDEIIANLRELHKHERTQKKRLLWFLGGLVLVIVVVLLIDALNGNFGYFRY